jgi:hypothetical protein
MFPSLELLLMQRRCLEQAAAPFGRLPPQFARGQVRIADPELLNNKNAGQCISVERETSS